MKKNKKKKTNGNNILPSFSLKGLLPNGFHYNLAFLFPFYIHQLGA